MKQTILIVEDDASIARLITLELNHEGYETKWAADGAEGLDEAVKNDYDLVLLDVMLPTLNGIEVLRRLKAAKNTPVIIITARDQVVDKVSGLDLGASDYITKPFDISELLARIRANLRKPVKAEADAIKHGRLSIRPESKQVFVDEAAVELTKKEYDLLIYLIENKGKVISREKIAESVWGFEYYGNTNLVDVYISYLRNKIEEKFGIKLIKTVRGTGYMIER